MINFLHPIGLSVAWFLAIFVMLLLTGKVLISNPIALAVVSFFVSTCVGWWIWQAKSNVSSKMRDGDTLPDIREILRRFSKLKNYDVRKFINPKKGLFLGLDTANIRVPVYAPWNMVLSTHCALTGSSGSGKGIAAAIMLAQHMAVERSIFVFDPKPDRYLPRILAEEAKRLGRPFYLFDLRPEAAPQFNILAGASANEIEDLFGIAFMLEEKGDKADVYRVRDREAARAAAQIAVQGGMCLPQLVQAAVDNEQITEATKFWSDLRELASLLCFDTEHAFDIAKAMRERAVVYVIGSAGVAARTVRAQKMFFSRVLNVINSLSHGAPSTTILADEFKHLLSISAVNAIGVVRDFNSHIILSHQSLSDLGAGTVNQDVARSVIDNTTIKLIYRLGSATDAKDIALTAGMHRGRTESTSSPKQLTSRSQGSFQEAPINRIPPELLCNLPRPSDRPNAPAVGVLFGVGLARPISLSPLTANGAMPKIVSRKLWTTSDDPANGAKDNRNANPLDDLI